MEYEKKSDIQMAMEQLEDEIKGIDAYKMLYEKATCPQLKKIAKANLAGEKQHAMQLTTWIHNYIEAEMK